jgi:CheY-like chemotaxis protein
MEDEEYTANFIGETLESFGCNEIFYFSNKEEAVEAATNGQVRNFILDIHMGKKRHQEGIDSLEEIKATDSSIFVAILSAYDGNHRKMAERLNVDFFQSKTEDRSKDIKNILVKMLESIDSKIQTVRLDLIESNEQNAPDDINVCNFNELKKDKHWLEKNLGLFIALNEGKIIALEEDRDLLLKRVREIMPKRKIFISEVCSEVEIIDFSGPFEVID